jgi:long-chain fatty acid transport protein
MNRKLTLWFMIALFATTFAKAGGYQINIQGIKQNGMGYIGTGFTLDASSVFFNPGGMSFIKTKYSFVAGVSGVFANTTFKKITPSAYQAQTDNPLSPPLHFYGTYKINNKLSVGIGVNTPFGNSLKWGDTWDGRYLITDISFHAFNFQPTVSYKFCDYFSIGAGFNYMSGTVSLSKMLPVSDASGEGKSTLEGNTSNFGYSIGIMAKPTANFGIGITYRSKIEMKMEGGDVTFKIPASLSANFPSGVTFDAMLPMPANLNIGISYQVNDKLLIGADLNYVFWSVYDSLIFDFSPNTSSLEDSRNPRLYEDAPVIRVGAQYQYNDKLTCRAGVYFDKSPVKDDYLNPETPSTNQIGLSLGASYKVSDKLNIDASFVYLMGLQRDANYSPANFAGTYKSTTLLPGIGVSYNF